MLLISFAKRNEGGTVIGLPRNRLKRASGCGKSRLRKTRKGIIVNEYERPQNFREITKNKERLKHKPIKQG